LTYSSLYKAFPLVALQRKVEDAAEKMPASVSCLLVVVRAVCGGCSGFNMRKEWTQEKPGWENFPGEPTDGISSKMDGEKGEK
jgi:hypothetical protein